MQPTPVLRPPRAPHPTPDLRPTPSFRPPRPPHPTFPPIVSVVALVLVAAPLVASRTITDRLDRADLPLPGFVAIAVLATYGPALVWWLLASGWFGTGHRRRDVGVIARVPDLWWGLLTWLTCLAAQVAMALVVVGLGIPFRSNVENLGGSDVDVQYAVTLIVLTVVVAPLAEEIIFRGLVMRGLLRVMSPGWAIALQAVLFGAAHIDPERGAGNVGLVLVLSSVGAVLGGAAYLHRRLTSSMIAHAIINGVAVAIALWGPDLDNVLNVVRR